MAAVKWLGERLHAINPNMPLVPSKNTSEGSWLISPEQQIYEFIFLNLFFPLLLFVLGSSSKPTKPRPSGFFSKLLALLLAVAFSIIVYFKLRDVGRWPFLLMPCHVFTPIQLYLLLSSSPQRNVYFQHYLFFCWPQLFGIIFPDTTGYTNSLEILTYWIQHVLLVGIPMYQLVEDESLSTAYQYDLRTHLRAWAITTLFQQDICWPVAILTTRNVNFMLSPPKIKPLVQTGVYYRLVVDIMNVFLNLFAFFYITITARLITATIRLFSFIFQRDAKSLRTNDLHKD